MSYDLRIGVKVEGAQDLYAVIAEPEFSSPTYNLRKMFVACMGWDYEQGKWYKVTDVLPMIQHGIKELKFHHSKYRKYDAPNGWGTVESALKALESLEQCIRDNSEGASTTWNAIPIELMYMRW